MRKVGGSFLFLGSNEGIDYGRRKNFMEGGKEKKRKEKKKKGKEKKKRKEEMKEMRGKQNRGGKIRAWRRKGKERKRTPIPGALTVKSCYSEN